MGVLDKAVSILDALDAGPLALARLVEATGLSRATAHRLACALEAHRLVDRDAEGRFCLGGRMARAGLAELARSALEWLRDETGESVQLYVRKGAQRQCVAALESPHGLRTIVSVGALLPLERGSAGRVLSGAGEGDAAWVGSVEERQRGVASVSAPVHDAHGGVIAAISVSGPIERTTRAPGKRYALKVMAAAEAIEHALRGATAR